MELKNQKMEMNIRENFIKEKDRDLVIFINQFNYYYIFYNVQNFVI